MTTDRQAETEELDTLFAAMRADAPVPSEALMARVLADALHEQPRVAAAATGRAVRPSLWARLVAGLGGGMAVAGVGSAALAGLMIGFVQPSALNGLTDAVWGTTYETVQLMPSVDALMTGE